MQGKDPFLVLLGLFILSTTFFFCGKELVNPPPPVSMEAPPIISPPDSRNVDLSPSALPVSAPVGSSRKTDERLIRETSLFQLNSATLLQEGKTLLNGVAARLHDDPSAVLDVDNYMASMEPEQMDPVLSGRRAQAVVEYLLTKGIPSEQLIVKEYGAVRLVAERVFEERRRKDRTSELFLGAEGAQP